MNQNPNGPDHVETPQSPVQPPPAHPQAYPPPYYQGYPPPPPQRSPFLAAMFSFVLCGLGQVYAGLYQRGIVLFLSFGGILAALVNRANHEAGGEVAFLGPALAFLWFFNIIDAYRQTSLRAYGLRDEEIAMPKRSNLGLGIALLVVGAYGLLRRYFDFDLGFLLDHWYLIVMAVGGLFVYQALRARDNGESAG